MLLVCGFYNSFSISAPFDPLQVSLVMQVPQVPKNWPGALLDGQIRFSLVQGQFLCIYATAGEC